MQNSPQKPDSQPSNKGLPHCKSKALKEMGTPGGNAKVMGKPGNPHPGK